MNEDDLNHWVYEIVSGMWDPWLDEMFAQVRDRLKYRTAMASIGLSKGDHATLTNVSDKLKGLEVEILTNGGGRLEVRSVDPVRFFGKEWRVSPSQVIPTPTPAPAEATP